MLTNDDVLWMKENRKEVVFNRESPVTLVTVGDGEVDEWTGEVSAVTTETEATAVVTELSSMTGAGIDRTLFGGVLIEKGDIQVGVSVEYINDPDAVKRVVYNGKTYEILAIDGKGIGMTNRYEALGREQS